MKIIRNLVRVVYSTIFVISTACIIAFPTQAKAQSKFFSTPNRGGAEGAKANAQIQALLNENIARRAETTANASSITHLKENVAAHEERLDDAEADLADIEAHARAALAACSSAGKVLQWDGAAWSCADETDPTVGKQGRATDTPPFCHPTNGKLIWAVNNGGQWECVADMNNGEGGGWSGSETDPTVHAFAKSPLPPCAAGQVLKSNGAGFICVSALTNINLSGASNGQVLVYNSSNGNWEPGTVSAALPDCPNGDTLIRESGAWFCSSNMPAQPIGGQINGAVSGQLNGPGNLYNTYKGSVSKSSGRWYFAVQRVSGTSIRGGWIDSSQSLHGNNGTATHANHMGPSAPGSASFYMQSNGSMYVNGVLHFGGTLTYPGTGDHNTDGWFYVGVDIDQSKFLIWGGDGTLMAEYTYTNSISGRTMVPFISSFDGHSIKWHTTKIKP